MMFDPSKLSAADRILRAKVQVYKESPFFAYILLHMRPVIDNNIPTICVNIYGQIRFNEEWIKSLSHEQTQGVLMHEAMHLALMHLERTRGRNPELKNITDDMVVNNMLVSQGAILPQCGIIPQNNSFTLKHIGHTIEKINEKSSEQIYDEIYPLLPKMPSPGKGSGKGRGSKRGKDDGKGDSDNLPQGFDEHEYGGNKESDKEDKEDKQEKPNWKRIVSEAASVAKQQGKLPAGLERMIEDLLESKIDWKSKLIKYVVEALLADYTWNMPSKRTMGLGIYTPKQIKDGVHVVVMFDTSGSMSAKDIAEGKSELVGISNSFPAVKIDAIVCDAEVHEVYDLMGDEIDQILSMKMSGGGGTDHRPAFKYVVENIPDAKVVIAFTDLFTSFPEKKEYEDYAFDTLWVVGKGGAPNEHAPFGEVIRVE